ncbi:hypothetical protein AXF42_Ash003948 [Apostasia shenzhenica]|uniref:Uncharacterized protein n=1 Tax=Apostasia shenzhenica TaxID=1088818 RepID=A0A2I0AIF1_9ASPA|nr:hypothetical protein AXF42_Ash003948 [Apostasia shenzhenica]
MRDLALCDWQERAALKMVWSGHVDSDRCSCATSWPMFEEIWDMSKHRGRCLGRAEIYRSSILIDEIWEGQIVEAEG